MHLRRYQSPVRKTINQWRTKERIYNHKQNWESLQGLQRRHGNLGNVIKTLQLYLLTHASDRLSLMMKRWSKATSLKKNKNKIEEYIETIKNSPKGLTQNSEPMRGLGMFMRHLNKNEERYADQTKRQQSGKIPEHITNLLKPLIKAQLKRNHYGQKELRH